MDGQIGWLACFRLDSRSQNKMALFQFLKYLNLVFCASGWSTHTQAGTHAYIMFPDLVHFTFSGGIIRVEVKLSACFIPELPDRPFPNFKASKSANRRS